MTIRLGLVLLMAFSSVVMARAAVTPYAGDVLIAGSGKPEKTRFQFRVSGQRLKGAIVSDAQQSLLQVRGRVTSSGRYRARISGSGIRRGSVAGRVSSSEVKGRGFIVSRSGEKLALSLESALLPANPALESYEGCSFRGDSAFDLVQGYWRTTTITFDRADGPSEEYIMTVTLQKPGVDIVGKYRVRPVPTSFQDADDAYAMDSSDSIQVSSTIENAKRGKAYTGRNIDPGLARFGALNVTVRRGQFAGKTIFDFTLSCFFNVLPVSYQYASPSVVGGVYSGLDY